MKDTAETSPPKPSMHLNWEEWLPFLEDKDIPDADKRQTIEALWFVMSCFADFGWETAQRPKNGGQNAELTAVLRKAVLNSSKPNSDREAI